MEPRLPLMDKWPMELLGVLVFLVLKEHGESLGCHMSVMSN